MTLRFSRAEYWLLDIAVREYASIADLINGDAAGQVNKSDHKCTADELADALERLFYDRLIVSFRHGGRRTHRRLNRRDIEVELTRPKILRAPDDPINSDRRHPDETYFELTPAGGAAWEDFARPNWDLFIDGVGTRIGGDGEPPSPCRGYAISTNRRIIEGYIQLASHIGFQIDMESIRWDILKTWKATYWRTLPTAHRARFKMTYHKVYSGNNGWPPLALQVYDLSRKWYVWRS